MAIIRLSRANAGRVLQGARGSVAARQHVQRGRPDVVLPRQPAVPVRAARPHVARRPTTRSRSACAWRGRSRAAASSSAPAARASAIFRSSCPGSSPTASRGDRSMSTTTSRLGECAYGSLEPVGGRGVRRGVRRARRDKFVGFMDVLADVSERTTPARRATDVLRLYEKWLRTGSRARRPAAGRARHPPQQLHRQAFVQ